MYLRDLLLLSPGTVLKIPRLTSFLPSVRSSRLGTWKENSIQAISFLLSKVAQTQQWLVTITGVHRAPAGGVPRVLEMSSRVQLLDEGRGHRGSKSPEFTYGRRAKCPKFPSEPQTSPCSFHVSRSRGTSFLPSFPLSSFPFFLPGSVLCRTQGLSEVLYPNPTLLESVLFHFCVQYWDGSRASGMPGKHAPTECYTQLKPGIS